MLPASCGPFHSGILTNGVDVQIHAVDRMIQVVETVIQALENSIQAKLKTRFNFMRH